MEFRHFSLQVVYWLLLTWQCWSSCGLCRRRCLTCPPLHQQQHCCSPGYLIWPAFGLEKKKKNLTIFFSLWRSAPKLLSTELHANEFRIWQVGTVLLANESLPQLMWTPIDWRYPHLTAPGWWDPDLTGCCLDPHLIGWHPAPGWWDPHLIGWHAAPGWWYPHQIGWHPAPGWWYPHLIGWHQGWASILFKRTERSLRSFPFFIKERNDLCALFRSL